MGGALPPFSNIMPFLAVFTIGKVKIKTNVKFSCFINSPPLFFMGIFSIYFLPLPLLKRDTEIAFFNKNWGLQAQKFEICMAINVEKTSSPPLPPRFVYYNSA